MLASRAAPAVRRAPPAGVICNSGGVWRAMHVALYMLAAAVLAAWATLLAAPAAPSIAAVAAAATAAAGVGASTWRATRPVSARLAWDGARWLVDGEPGTVDVMLDLGAWLLLRFRPDGRRLADAWLPVANAAQPLRAALYASRPPAAEPQRG